MLPLKQSLIAFLSLGVASLAISGCGGLIQTAPPVVPGHAFQGSVHGGQQPVSGSAIALYAAGNSGYGSAYPYSAGTSLLGNNTVTTDANGAFSITGDYTCPSAATLVYLVATGGNPGLSNNASNPNLALMAALGPCGSLTPSTFISMNEVTTVASVWALSPFMSGPSNIGTTPTNAQGLTNAFAAVNKLANTGTGAVGGPALPTAATLPVSKINTLADILAACVNTAGGRSGDSSACGTLFAASTVNGTAPTDTITAAMNIARHPNQSVATLVGLALPTAPFQPTVAMTPNDLTIAVSYSGGGLSSPKGIAVDSVGNVWVPNAGNNSVTKLSNAGAAISGVSGFTASSLSVPSGIAIDASGNAWVANAGNTQITAMSTDGSAFGGSPFNVGAATNALAIDAAGNVWAASSNANLVTVLNSSGATLQTITTGVAAPQSIAINPK